MYNNNIIANYTYLLRRRYDICVMIIVTSIQNKGRRASGAEFFIYLAPNKIDTHCEMTLLGA